MGWRQRPGPSQMPDLGCGVVSILFIIGIFPILIIPVLILYGLYVLFIALKS